MTRYNSKNADELKATAMERADMLTDPAVLTKFTKAFLAYLDEMNKVAPDGDGKETKGKKAATAS